MSMTSFDYRVRNPAGKIVKGKVEADSEALALAKLRGMGLAPLEVTPANQGLQRDITMPSFGGNKVKLKDLAVISRQFATMINSGLSLLRALTILQEQTDQKALKTALDDVRRQVESGVALSTAMARHARVFPPLMVNMTRAGEVGGFLDQTLLNIAENFEAEVKLRGKVKAALTYPVVVLVMAAVMCTIMLIFIVPTFASMFATLGGELPLATRVLVKLSGLMKIVAPLAIAGGIAFSFVWPRFKHDDRLRAVLDPLKLKLPIFGSLVQKIAVSRFTRNLGTMLRSGVPILQSLDIVADTSGNIVIRRAVHDIQATVRTGESLTKPLERHKVFPPMVVQMLVVGEDTGALDVMLSKISDFYDQEVEATTESLTALIEPLMIAVLGIVVGSMILALYAPIFKVFDYIQ